MGSLNPQWLSIELQSIDATVENWSSALWTSYESALHALINDQAVQDRLANVEVPQDVLIA